MSSLCVCAYKPTQSLQVHDFGDLTREKVMWHTKTPHTKIFIFTYLTCINNMHILLMYETGAAQRTNNGRPWTVKTWAHTTGVGWNAQRLASQTRCMSWNVWLVKPGACLETFGWSNQVHVLKRLAGQTRCMSLLRILTSDAACWCQCSVMPMILQCQESLLHMQICATYLHCRLCASCNMRLR
jgi:hypothetical protein